MKKQIFISTILFLLPLKAQVVDLIINDVKLFDGIKVISKTSIIVKDGKILDITKNSSQYKANSIIDGSGKTVIPSLLNAHVHAFSPEHLKQALNSGVFALFDLHASEEASKLLKGYRDSLEYANYYSSGFSATVPKGHGTQFGVDVPTINDSVSAEEFVNQRIKNGCDYIKIGFEPRMPTLSFEQIDTIITVTHQNNLKVLAHISFLEDAIRIVESKIDGLAHIWSDKQISSNQLSTLKKNKVYIIPTLITLQRALKLGEQQGWAKNLLTFKNIQEEVMSVYDANIPILAGTDPPNFDINYGNDLLKEIQLLAESGLLPIDALKAATSNIAIEFDIPNLGFIKKGEEANFIIVNGDPTQYISSIENIESIWKNGIKINEP
tara:strand:- start:80 stop:1222 length:1143 start_codon:yes stop_codon:yes gene_type:complete